MCGGCGKPSSDARDLGACVLPLLAATASGAARRKIFIAGRCDRAPPKARALLPATRCQSSGPLGALLSSPALDVRLLTALQVLQVHRTFTASSPFLSPRLATSRGCGGMLLSHGGTGAAPRPPSRRRARSCGLLHELLAARTRARGGTCACACREIFINQQEITTLTSSCMYVRDMCAKKKYVLPCACFFTEFVSSIHQRKKKKRLAKNAFQQTRRAAAYSVV